MISQISPELMEAYRATARRRRQKKEIQLKRKRENALHLAKEAAEILKQQFGAKRVVLFGSLLVSERFHERSDIDLAVWGLAEKDYYRSVGRLLSLDLEFNVDLIRIEWAPSKLAEAIEQEGIEL
jgi:predicted nucleotidyltransferase